MKVFFATLIMFCVSSIVMAQKPIWANGYHKDLTNSYIDVFPGSGNSPSEARKDAIQNIVKGRILATNQSYSFSESNGNLVFTASNEIEIKSRIIDQYQEYSDGVYKVFLLAQTAKHPDFTYEPVNVTDRYSAGARILVPGWAQIYKGQTAKGLVMLAGVIGCGIGALVCENTRSDYKNKMKEQPEFAQTYNTKANNNETARNVFLGAAAAFYVWNIIDGIASKGKRRVFVGKNSNLAVNPFATTEGSGLSLAYNF